MSTNARHVWVKGEPITADLLNDIEAGIETNRYSVDALASACNDLKADKADRSDLKYTEGRLQNLIYLLNGVAYREISDNDKAAVRIVAKDSSTGAIHGSGVAEWAFIDELRGETLYWNQLIDHGLSIHGNSISIDTLGDGSISIHTNGNTTSAATGHNIVVGNDVHYFPVIAGHVYYVRGCENATTTALYFRCMPYGTSAGSNAIFKTSEGFIFTANNSYEQVRAMILVNSGLRIEPTDPVIIRPQLYDLTAMFGEGNEPTSEQFDEWFPADYYPYNAGEWKAFGVERIESYDNRGSLVDAVDVPEMILNLNSYGFGNNYVDVRKGILYRSHVLGPNGPMGLNGMNPIELDMNGFGLIRVSPGGNLHIITRDGTRLPTASKITYQIKTGGA